MTRWFSTSLGDAMLADAALPALRNAFLARYDTVADAAIYLRHESEGRLHCELVAYFPPACVALAREYAAHPCGSPAREGLTLFVGREHDDSPGTGTNA